MPMILAIYRKDIRLSPTLGRLFLYTGSFFDIFPFDKREDAYRCVQIKTVCNIKLYIILISIHIHQSTDCCWTYDVSSSILNSSYKKFNKTVKMSPRKYSISQFAWQRYTPAFTSIIAHFVQLTEHWVWDQRASLKSSHLDGIDCNAVKPTRS